VRRTVVVLLLFAAGCDQPRPYADLPEKNLSVRTVVTNGRVELDMHSLDRSCDDHYEGFVALDRPVVGVGLPMGKRALLVFSFHSSDTPIKKEIQIVPREGSRYEVRVSYKDSIYDIEVREIDPRTGAEREIDTLRRCS